MDVQVVKNDEQGLYELGAEVDGVFVPFVSLPITQVDSHVENAKASAQQPAEQETASWGA